MNKLKDNIEKINDTWKISDKIAFLIEKFNFYVLLHNPKFENMLEELMPLICKNAWLCFSNNDDLTFNEIKYYLEETAKQQESF